MEEILVVIPYLAKDAQGSELELAVTGWRKYFKEKFRIVVVGDYHPIVDSGDDITFIKCPRVKWPGEGNYWAHIDHVNKFRTVWNAYPKSKGFIYSCDDIYAVNEFTMEDVMKPKARCRQIDGDFTSTNKWVVDNYRTKKLLIRDRYPTMNWVCHLPVYYEWDKLFDIYERYDCDEKSRVVEQLYFNIYYGDSDYVVIEEEPNNYQYKVWEGKHDIDGVEEALNEKIWISNSVKGWKPELEQILREHYGL